MLAGYHQTSQECYREVTCAKWLQGPAWCFMGSVLWMMRHQTGNRTSERLKFGLIFIHPKWPYSNLGLPAYENQSGEGSELHRDVSTLQAVSEFHRAFLMYSLTTGSCCVCRQSTQTGDLAMCLGEKSKVFSFFLTMHRKQEGSPSSITMPVQKKRAIKERGRWIERDRQKICTEEWGFVRRPLKNWSHL